MTHTALRRQAAADAYRDSAVENAPPVVVVRLLLEGALRFLDRAEASDPRTRGSGFAENLGRADAVVVELRLALAHSAQPEISRQFAELYLFIEASLRRALRERDRAPIAEARLVLGKLLDGWSRIDLGSAQQVA